MREFRFRAFVDGDMGMPFNAFDPEFMSTGGTFPEGAVIMQYTGLKDKNGVEIYEGDIVNLHPEENDSGWHRVIKWDTAAFHCKQIHGKANYPLHFHKYVQDTLWVIIGNIYQNPELLNTKP